MVYSVLPHLDDHRSLNVFFAGFENNAQWNSVAHFLFIERTVFFCIYLCGFFLLLGFNCKKQTKIDIVKHLT